MSNFAVVSGLTGALLLAGLATAQKPGKTVWDGAYTEAQAERGAKSYSASCLGCHALTADGKAPLVGNAFYKSFAQKSVGEMLDFISKYMPNGNAGTLSENTYDDIVAYILKSNGFPAGTTEVGKTMSGGFEIIQKEGGSALPSGALVHIVGCLSKKGTDWVVTRATTPERAERVDRSTGAGGDATRALGTRTMTLKYMLQQPTSLANARVTVDGLLIGEGGVDGINVTTLSKVAAKCP